MRSVIDMVDHLLVPGTQQFVCREIERFEGVTVARTGKLVKELYWGKTETHIRPVQLRLCRVSNPQADKLRETLPVIMFFHFAQALRHWETWAHDVAEPGTLLIACVRDAEEQRRLLCAEVGEKGWHLLPDKIPIDSMVNAGDVGPGLGEMEVSDEAHQFVLLAD